MHTYTFVAESVDTEFQKKYLVNAMDRMIAFADAMPRILQDPIWETEELHCIFLESIRYTKS